MWQIISPNSCSSSEPIELKRLKFQLANNVCKCKICVDHEKSMLTSIPQENKETQLKNSQASLVRIINKIPSSPHCRDLTENVSCPGCYMALNLFQKKNARVLKDEESETNNKMFSSDKSTEKKASFLEKATCMTNTLIPKYSNITFCDTMTDISTDVSLHSVLNTKRRHQVSFTDSEKENTNKRSYLGNCLCMENFINTIRPPLVDCDI